MFAHKRTAAEPFVGGAEEFFGPGALWGPEGEMALAEIALRSGQSDTDLAAGGRRADPGAVRTPQRG